MAKSLCTSGPQAGFLITVGGFRVLASFYLTCVNLSISGILMHFKPLPLGATVGETGQATSCGQPWDSAHFCLSSVEPREVDQNWVLILQVVHLDTLSFNFPTGRDLLGLGVGRPDQVHRVFTSEAS